MSSEPPVTQSASAPDAEPPVAEEPPGSDPASAAAPPSRRTAILRSGLIVGVLFVVFGLILPQFVDYSDVADAFRGLTTQQIIVITALGIVAWVASGLIFAALIEGLSIIRGTMSWLILAGIGASVPFGPWNMGVLWVVMRGWGIGIAPATSGVALYGVINILSRMPLPLLGIIALTIGGDLTNPSSAQTGWTVAILSGVAFVVVTGLIIGIVRSERIADRIGRAGQWAADRVVKLFGRTTSPDVAGAIHRFRDQLGVVIRRRGLVTLVVAIVSQFFWALVLLVALRMVGIPDTVLSNAVIFAVYGLVMVITIIPLSPGGAGVAELLFISAFTALAGDQYDAGITAGVFLYRIYFWFVPIPIAWILLKVVRRGRPMLPGTSELKAYASDGSA